MPLPKYLALGALALGLSACAETRLLVHATKEISRKIEPEAQTPAPARDQGAYKVGQPYQVGGVWYYPKEDPKYRETGIASWYGQDFHGRATANGEVYDMNGLTAAHKTLPMPSMVRVTNLENGRSLLLRVNDRGPFAHGRIIDVSRRAAQLLGFMTNGTARVQVEAIGSAGGEFVSERPTTTPEERRAVAAAPQEEVSVIRLTPPPGVTEAPNPRSLAAQSPAANSRLASVITDSEGVGIGPVKPTQIFVQAGAFIDIRRARELSANLAAIGESQVTKVSLDGTEFYRVRIGPMPSVEAADKALEQAIAQGHPEARIIVVD